MTENTKNNIKNTKTNMTEKIEKCVKFNKTFFYLTLQQTHIELTFIFIEYKRNET